MEEKSTELDGLRVPPGFSIERVAAPGMLTYPMFASFDGKGRLFVFESDGSSPSTESLVITTLKGITHGRRQKASDVSLTLG